MTDHCSGTGRRAWRALLVGLLALPGLALGTESCVTRLDKRMPERILFVGNSWPYYNDSLHNHVIRSVREKHGDAGDFDFKSATIGGENLDQHPVSPLLEPARLGVGEPFDLLVLQGWPRAAAVR